MGDSGPFAYLFERFPSFTQTFCAREVMEMRRQGVLCPIFSIRNPQDEPAQSFPPELKDSTIYGPEKFDEILASDGKFRRRARRGLDELRETWGDEGEKRRIYEALWLLPRLRERRIEHVHTHFAGSATRTAYWLKRFGGIRYSFTAHANDIFCDEPHERLASLIDGAEAVVTVSEFSAGMLRKKFPDAANKVHRVYNGIHPDRFRRGVPDSPVPLILSVGRYIEKKGFHDLIAACRRLEGQRFECQIVGQGPLEESLRKAAEGDDRIKITGPKTETEIVSLMARTTAFVLPCVDSESGSKDNLPTVIMEAMAASLPVVSTHLAGVPEMVIDGQTGFLVNAGNVEALAERISRLLGDVRLARQMGVAGRRLCEARFSTEKTTAELRSVLEACGAFKRQPRGFLDRLLGGFQ